MFKNLKAIADALDALRRAVEALPSQHQAGLTEVRTELARQRDRAEELDRDMRKPLREAEALLSKAETRFRAARSSEERARRYERGSGDYDDDEDDVDDDPAQLDFGVGAGGRAQGVQPVHPGVEVRPQADPAEIARAHKFSRG